LQYSAGKQKVRLDLVVAAEQRRQSILFLLQDLTPNPGGHTVAHPYKYYRFEIG
jgi:hypothetical protein